MNMEGMLEEIICEIMDRMDDETLLNSVKASDRFLVAFSNSLRHLTRFTLTVSPENVNAFISDKRILGIPFMKVSMSEISNENLEDFRRLADAFKDSIETLELKFCAVRSYSCLIGPLSQLKDLTLIQCSAENNAPIFPRLQHLKSVTFEKCGSQFFGMLKSQPELEKLKVIEHAWGSGFSHPKFNAFASSLPKFKHLVMEGVGTANYFETANFPYRIEKLEAYLTTFWWKSLQPRLEFFRSQKGSLKELTIHKLPYDYDGDEVLKYIIEELKLESFHFGKIPLILNGQKQDVKEFLAHEVNINAAFEMFRQFRTIETLNLFLTHTGLDNDMIHRTLSPRTDLFRNVRHLDILDHSGYEHLYLFRGLYKNCRNIKKLTINSNCRRLYEVLKEVLPELTQLNEIFLLTNLPNAVSRFQLIRNFGANVKKLSINANFANEAREFFGNDEIEIVGV